MENRPTSITVIGWITIAIAGVSVVAVLATLDNREMEGLMSLGPIPSELKYAMTYVGVLITFVCGVGFLLGENWSRFLYVIWHLIGFLLSYINYRFTVALIPGFTLLLLVAFFLFRPRANEFFT